VAGSVPGAEHPAKIEPIPIAKQSLCQAFKRSLPFRGLTPNALRLTSSGYID